MHNHGISHSHIADRRPNLMHPAGVFMSQGVRQAHARYFCPLSLNDMQVGATQTCATNAHNHIKRTSHLWFVHLLYLGLFVIVVQAYCFHIYSSIGNASGPTKREPGRPHSRKKSPVVRHNVTLTSLPARIKDWLRCLARLTLAVVTGEPSACVIRGASSGSASASPTARACSSDARNAWRAW